MERNSFLESQNMTLRSFGSNFTPVPWLQPLVVLTILGFSYFFLPITLTSNTLLIFLLPFFGSASIIWIVIAELWTSQIQYLTIPSLPILSYHLSSLRTSFPCLLFCFSAPFYCGPFLTSKSGFYDLYDYFYFLEYLFNSESSHLFCLLDVLQYLKFSVDMHIPLLVELFFPLFVIIVFVNLHVYISWLFIQYSKVMLYVSSLATS